LILIHAAAFDAVSEIAAGDSRAELAGALDWSRSAFADRSIDASSRDERLWRASTEKELGALLGALWGSERAGAQERLRAWLKRTDIPLRAGATPFDEAAEDETFPILVDAGWELLLLSELDPERHRGAIDAFGESILFESARFEESEAIPRRVSLHELSAIGPVEALSATSDTGELREPLVLWTEGNETYLDYVLRGVLRAAKL
jgi:hypothetical protein